jgi:RNA polymerase sigma factor (sigma-70 family)
VSEAVATGGGSGAGMTRVLSDESLARRAAKGEERAFATIFDRYHQRLYRYCLAIVGDAQDAQDALQNTMVKVLRGLPGEQRKIQLKPWLYRIAHNESIELLRRRRETRELDAGIAAPGSGPAEEAASRERLRRLISDLEALPERQRGALVMRELGGLEFAEIGTALGTSPAVARQTLYEARLSLRQMDEGREMSCAAVMKALSDGDGRVSRRRDLRAHLRTCASCRRFGEEIGGRQRDLAALAPLPAIAAAGLLQGVLGGAAGTGASGGLATAVGGGAAKSVGASVALKGVATVAVVAAIGVGAADRGGLIDAGLPGGAESQGAKSAPPDSGSAGASGNPAVVPPVAGARSATRARVHALGRTQEVSGPGVRGARATAGAAAGHETSATLAPAPAAPQSSAAHPHGKGHEKQLPSASAHGQQTAAAHDDASHGPAAATRHPSHPVKPPHPAKPSHPSHPSTPSAEKPPPSPTPAPLPEKRSPTARPPQNKPPPARIPARSRSSGVGPDRRRRFPLQQRGS